MWLITKELSAVTSSRSKTGTGEPSDGSRSRNGHNRWIVTSKRRMIKAQIANFNLVVPVTLVTFNDDEIAGCQLQ